MKKLARHLYEDHAQSGKVRCPVCNIWILERHLAAHLKKSKTHRRLLEERQKERIAEIDRPSVTDNDVEMEDQEQTDEIDQPCMSNDNGVALEEQEQAETPNDQEEEQNEMSITATYENNCIPEWTPYAAPRFFATENPPQVMFIVGMVLQWMREHFVPKTAMQVWIDGLHKLSERDLQELPNKLKTMLDIEESNALLSRRYEFQTNSQIIYFSSVLDCIGLMLDDPELAPQLVFHYDHNHGRIEHPCNGEIWRHFDEKTRELDRATGRKHLLIMPIWWMDEYCQCSTARRKDTAVVVTFANLPVRAMSNRRNKHLIALLPPNVDFHAAIEHIIGKPSQAMEKGLAIQTKRSTFLVAGSGGFVAGDQKGQALAGGLVGACSKHAPCRFSEAAKSELQHHTIRSSKESNSQGTEPYP